MLPGNDRPRVSDADGCDKRLVSILLLVSVVLDHDPFQKLSVPLFQESKSLAIISIMLQSLLHELKTGVVLVQDFSPSFHADGDIRAAVDQTTFGIRAPSNIG